jgi:hypothetical protein
MNPLLSQLQPYPFERLRQLFAGVQPPAAYSPISLGMGEPRHATPQFIKDALAENLLGYRTLPISVLIGEGKLQRTFDTASLCLAVPYAAEDADIALRLHQQLAPQVAAMGMTALHDDVELPLVRVLAEIEWNGIKVDPVELDRQRDALNLRIQQVRMDIADLAPAAYWATEARSMTRSPPRLASADVTSSVMPSAR